MAKPLLVFDFFGVVVGEVAHAWLYEHLGEEKAIWTINNLLPKGDKGLYDETKLFSELEKLSGVPANTIKEDWMKRGRLNEKTVNFIKNNQDKYHIVLLSNAIGTFIERFFVRDNTKELFSHRYISSELNLAKPDRAIFEYVLKNVPFPYSVSVMIDDSAHNISEAKKVGMHGVVFKDMDQTETELQKLLK